MPGLLELQGQFRAALLSGDAAMLAAAILDDGLPASVRLDIHRNNVFASLQAVLRDMFPAVCRLVDERFFDYAADAFIRAHPPDQACLFAYGAGFADFLATFPACRDLVYLPDVARLEWLMNRAAHAADATPLAPAALGAIGAADAPRLTVRFEPSLALLDSAWPIDRIWRANRAGDHGEATIDLAAGGVRLEVRRSGDNVVLRGLDPATYAFRARLARGATLAAATNAAVAADPAFDVVAAFGALFNDACVTDIALGPLSDTEMQP